MKTWKLNSLLLIAATTTGLIAQADPTEWKELTNVSIGNVETQEIDIGGGNTTKYTTVEFSGKSLSFFMKLLPGVKDSETNIPIDERKIEFRSNDLKFIRISCDVGYHDASSYVKYKNGPKCSITIIEGQPLAT